MVGVWPSVRAITCFSLALAARRMSRAWTIPGCRLVPPPSAIESIAAAICARLAAGVRSSTSCGWSSKAITASWSRLLSSSAAPRAACRASAIGSPDIEPDLSITSTIASEGFSLSFSKRETSGSTSSTGVLKYPPIPKLFSDPLITKPPPKSVT
jgi:hypothetical protein